MVQRYQMVEHVDEHHRVFRDAEEAVGVGPAFGVVEVVEVEEGEQGALKMEQ